MSFTKCCGERQQKDREKASLKRNFKAGCLAFCLAMCVIGAGSVSAMEEQTIVLEGAAVSLINETGISAVSAYVRPAGTRDWGEDVISGLNALDLTGSLYDLRIVGEGGEEAVFIGLPLSSAASIRLLLEGGYTYAETVDLQGNASVSVQVKTSTYPVLSEVFTQNTNVRTSDSTEGTLLTSIKVGQQVEVYGETANADRKWVMVWLGDRYAYCIGDYLKTVGTSGLPTPDAISGTPQSREDNTAPGTQNAAYTDAMMALGSSLSVPSGQDNLTVYAVPVSMKVTRNIKVRSGPGTDYQQVGSLKDGSETTAYGEIMTERKWSLVLYNGELRYCISDYLEPTEEVPASDVIDEAAVSEETLDESVSEETSEEVETADQVTEEAKDEQPEAMPAEDNEVTEIQAEQVTEAETEENTSTEAESEESSSIETETEESSSAEAETEESSFTEAETEESSSTEAETEESSSTEAEPEESSSIEAETEESSSTEAEPEENSSGQTEPTEIPAAMAESEVSLTTEAELEETSFSEGMEDGETLENEFLDAEEYGPSLEELHDTPAVRTLKKVETYSSIRRPGHGYRFMLFSDGTIEVQLY